MPSKPVGRIRDAAQMRPVSSSVAKSIFSIYRSGSTSLHTPQPWLTTACMTALFHVQLAQQ